MPQKQDRTTIIAFSVAGGVIALILVVGVVLWSVGTNAECPVCGERWHIPVHDKIAERSRGYTCPSCGAKFSAAILYDRRQASRD